MTCQLKPVFSTFLDDIHISSSKQSSPSGFNGISKSLANMPSIRWSSYKVKENVFYCVLQSRLKVYLLEVAGGQVNISFLPRQENAWKQVYYMLPMHIINGSKPCVFSQQSGFTKLQMEYSAYKQRNTEILEHLVHMNTRVSMSRNQGMLSKRLGEATSSLEQVSSGVTVDEVVDTSACGPYIATALGLNVLITSLYPTPSIVCVQPCKTCITSIAIQIVPSSMNKEVHMVVAVGTSCGVQLWYILRNKYIPIFLASYVTQLYITGMSMAVYGARLMLVLVTRDHRLQCLDQSNGQTNAPVCSADTAGIHQRFAMLVLEESQFLEKFHFHGKPTLAVCKDELHCHVTHSDGASIHFIFQERKQTDGMKSSTPLVHLSTGGFVACCHASLCSNITMNVYCECVPMLKTKKSQVFPVAAVTKVSHVTDISSVYRDHEWSANIIVPSLHIAALQMLLQVEYEREHVPNDVPGGLAKFAAKLRITVNNITQTTISLQCNHQDCVLSLGLTQIQCKPVIVVLYSHGLVQFYSIPYTALESSYIGDLEVQTLHISSVHNHLEQKCKVIASKTNTLFKIYTDNSLVATLRLPMAYQKIAQLAISHCSTYYIACYNEQDPFLRVYVGNDIALSCASYILNSSKRIQHMFFHCLESVDDTQQLVVVQEDSWLQYKLVYAACSKQHSVQQIHPQNMLSLPPQSKILSLQQCLAVYPSMKQHLQSCIQPNTLNLYIPQQNTYFTVISIHTDTSLYNVEYLMMPILK